MNLWLCVPPRPRDQMLNCLPPYALGYLATAVRRGGHQVRILDCPLHRLDVTSLVELAAREKPEIIGFTLFSSDFAAVAEACRALRRLPDSPALVLGGIHPSSYAIPTLQALPEADYVIAGEAEESLPALLSALESPAPGSLARIPGLGWREEGRVRSNASSLCADLDTLGLPAWDLINPLHYQAFPPTLFVRQRPFAPLITTRGCPFHCTYCGGHNVSGYRLRSRSLDLVFSEISLLRERFGIRELHIEDDNFTWDRGRVVRFCEELLRRDWRLTWTMPNGVRLDTLDLELLCLMKRAGCYFLILGVESGSDRILQHMRKKITQAQVVEKAALVARAGILPHAFFMLGYPGETEADLRATLDLALRLPLIGAHFSIFRPLPGTAISEELLARGEIQEFVFTTAKSTFASAVYAPRGFTPGQIKTWQRRMLVAFYFRFRILWRYGLEVLRHPGLAVNLFRRAWLYLFRA